jgi:hypothetical protein
MNILINRLTISKNLLIFVFSLLAYSSTFAQDTTINLDELINETQHMSEDPDVMRLVWYIPIEYWKATFEGDPTISQKEVEEIIDVLDDYEMFAMLDGTFGVFGNIKYKEKSETKRGLTLETSNGIKYYPLDDNEINDETLTLLSLMQPILTGMMGAMGENMQFFLFKGKNADQRLLDPLKPNNFKVNMMEESFNFELPLAALLPPKFCPEDNKKMKGTWSYCPFHGLELKGN